MSIRNRLWSRIASLASVGALGVALAGGLATFAQLPGCSTPSVPLPPPEVDLRYLAFSSPTPGEVVLSGMARETHVSVTFYFVNEVTGDGVITSTKADGSFSSAPLAAQEGDVARLQFATADGTLSNPTCVTILVGQSLIGATCQ